MRPGKPGLLLQVETQRARALVDFAGRNSRKAQVRSYSQPVDNVRYEHQKPRMLSPRSGALVGCLCVFNFTHVDTLGYKIDVAIHPQIRLLVWFFVF